MRDRGRWTAGIVKWSIFFGTLGLLAAAGAVWLPAGLVGANIKGGFLPGASVVLLGLGIVSLVQYLFVRRHPNAGSEMMIQESDERMQSIRARAGYRAFQISSSLGFAVLTWAALAGNAGLPALSYKELWFAFLAVGSVSFGIYVTGILYGEKHD